MANKNFAGYLGNSPVYGGNPLFQPGVYNMNQLYSAAINRRWRGMRGVRIDKTFFSATTGSLLIQDGGIAIGADIADWVVPEGVNSIFVQILGKGGDSNSNSHGGTGSYLEGVIKVTPFETLNVSDYYIKRSSTLLMAAGCGGNSGSSAATLAGSPFTVTDNTNPMNGGNAGHSAALPTNGISSNATYADAGNGAFLNHVGNANASGGSAGTGPTSSQPNRGAGASITTSGVWSVDGLTYNLASTGGSGGAGYYGGGGGGGYAFVSGGTRIFESAGGGGGISGAASSVTNLVYKQITEVNAYSSGKPGAYSLFIHAANDDPFNALYTASLRPGIPSLLASGITTSRGLLAISW